MADMKKVDNDLKIINFERLRIIMEFFAIDLRKVMLQEGFLKCG